MHVPHMQLTYSYIRRLSLTESFIINKAIYFQILNHNKHTYVAKVNSHNFFQECHNFSVVSVITTAQITSVFM